MTTPETVGEIAAKFIANTPSWQACTKCGQQTSGKVCFDCWARMDALRKATEATEASIPPAFRWAWFDSDVLGERVLGGNPSVAKARDAVLRQRTVLIGASGAGKTSLAIAIMRAWSRGNALAAMFVLATDLATCQKRTRLGVEPDTIAAAVAAPLLLIDDVGTESHEKDSAVVEVVFHRHAADLPTIVTTWLGDAETVNNRGAALSERYGNGFARRVVGNAKIIHLGGT